MIVTPTADVPSGSDAVMWAAGLESYGDHGGDGADVGVESHLGGVTFGLDGEVRGYAI